MSGNTQKSRSAKKGHSPAKRDSPAIPTATTRQTSSASASASASHHKKLFVSFKTEKSTPLIKETGSSASAQQVGIDSQTMDTLKSEEAENTTGPWLCLKCSVCLPSYKDFRLHLIDMHKETIDPALCEHCGWKLNNNRELHFHMYTDHQIKSLLYTFAECDLCDRKYSSKDELEAHMTECLKAPFNAIEESDQDPEDDGSIIYDIILETMTMTTTMCHCSSDPRQEKTSR
ncbi:centrosome-associated zinc finger protein CP190-like isoform X2 [Drosophila obscura]|uniref:centrosome-associated zinc finger protein CP190-like isoform X2 n=1 Tax=Drosophila obscura TaxID=7282 RepID=UPI001BB29BC8|nr:centrosome-associated zinc finger protein CP190-like isoform X2 [Drosophila obscura]